jgi:hypothetical protein
MNSRTAGLRSCALLAGGLLAAVASRATAQTVIDACYVANTGVIYMIDPLGTLPGALPTECRSADKHIRISWTDGEGADHALLANLTVGDPHTQYLPVDGSRGMTGPLSVTGLVESTTGGFKFPDGTTQTTAATSGLSDHGSLIGLIDDDHPQYLLTEGVRSSTNGFAVTAAGSGSIPTTGPGTRLMWFPGKGAFRVGRVEGAQWDLGSVGYYSGAMGQNTTASGNASTAMGNGTVAGGDASTAMGERSTASGIYSTAMGYHTTASAGYSTAMGYHATASGATSTAMGNGTMASGGISTAMGASTKATGDFSTATGWGTVAGGRSSTAMGENSTADGYYSTAMGYVAKASGAYSVAMGHAPTASGSSSTALGHATMAGGSYSTAMGYKTTASGVSTTAMGVETTASGSASTAMGNQTIASGNYSTAMGAWASTNSQQGAFVYGDATTTTMLAAPAANSFTVRATGGTTFYSNSSLSAGVSLAPGAGAWATVSDRNRKRDFHDVDGEVVLASIAKMPIQSWSYRSQDPSIRHLGPVAQDFYAAFKLGESDLTITTSDISGVNMLAIQALERRTRILQAENRELRDRLARVEAMLAGLSKGRE